MFLRKGLPLVALWYSQHKCVFPVSPVVTVTPVGPVQVRVGDPITLECQAGGEPHPSVSWHRLDNNRKTMLKSPLPMESNALLQVLLKAAPVTVAETCLALTSPEIRPFSSRFWSHVQRTAALMCAQLKTLMDSLRPMWKWLFRVDLWSQQHPWWQLLSHSWWWWRDRV